MPNPPTDPPLTFAEAFASVDVPPTTLERARTDDATTEEETRQEIAAVRTAHRANEQRRQSTDPTLLVREPRAGGLPNAREPNFQVFLDAALGAAPPPREEPAPLRMPPAAAAEDEHQAAAAAAEDEHQAVAAAAEDEDQPAAAGGGGRPQQTTTRQEHRQRIESRRATRREEDPERTRDTLTMDRAKGNVRSKGVLKRRKSEATRFILFLHNNKPELVAPPLTAKLLTANLLMANSTRTWPTEKAREKARELYLRKVIEEDYERREALINFGDVLADDVGDYLCERRRLDGGLMRGKAYKNIRSSIAMFFKDFGHKWSDDFTEEFGDIISGIVRTVSQAEQAGVGVIEEGKREMSFELYCAINKWFLKLGTKEAVFGRAYLQCCWNLICRSESTAQIRHKHLLWRTDSVGIPFAHEKVNQEGDSRRKKNEKLLRQSKRPPCMYDHRAL
jgi:hypothetical protein